MLPDQRRDGILEYIEKKGFAGLHELSELLELRESELAVDAEFSGDLVHAWFTSHNSPVRVGPP